MIIITGDVLIDLVGNKSSFVAMPGGSLYNVSLAMGRLNGGVYEYSKNNTSSDIVFINSISKDLFGEMLIKGLKESGVNLDYIIRSNKNSSLAIANNSDKNNISYNFYTEDTSDTSLEVDQLKLPLKQDVSCVIFGSFSVTLEPYKEALKKIINKYKNSSILSFDPNFRESLMKDRDSYKNIFDTLISVSDIVKISEEDIENILDISIDDAVLLLFSKGVKIVVVTLGGNGSKAFVNNSSSTDLKDYTQVFEPIYDIPVVDTVGAGDTFHGAFITSLKRTRFFSKNRLKNINGKTLQAALKYASYAAALNCSKEGCNPPYYDEL